MQVVILCGGKATRLYPLTQKIPKSMIKIAGKPFLEHQLELLKKNNLNSVLLCIGYLGEKIKDYFQDGRKMGIDIQYSFEKKPLETGGALKNAEDLLESNFLVMYSDSYLPFDFQKTISFFRQFDKLGLMVVYHNVNKYEPSNVVVEGDLIKHYSKAEKAPNMEYIDYGVSIFKKEALKLLLGNYIFDLSQLHKLLIEKKELLAYSAEERFYEIGSLKGLEEFKKYIKNI